MSHKFEAEYRELVVPYAPGRDSRQRILIPDHKLEKIRTLARQIAEAKAGEAHHIIDGASEYKRQYTGLLGEAALEEYFGIDIIDHSVGSSNAYNSADLRKIGLDIGVKTVEVWKFPIVHKHPIRPELICVKRKENEVIFFGYASKNVLARYQTDRFILDRQLKQRGTKSAFYGFSQLIPIDSLEKLKEVYHAERNGGLHHGILENL